MIHLYRSRSMVGVALLVLGGLACDRPSSGGAAENAQTTASPQAVVGATTTSSLEQAPTTQATTTEALATTETPGGAPVQQTTLDVSSLDDAALAAVLQSIHLRIAQEAQVAEATTKTREVAQLAHEMSLLHTHVLTADQTLFQQLSIVPRVNAVSLQIDADTTNIVSALRGSRDGSFDRDYLEGLTLHLQESSQLFDRMIAVVRDPALEAEISRNRADLGNQLLQASRVQQGLRPGVTNMQPSNRPEK
jgi:hypothetical protein